MNNDFIFMPICLNVAKTYLFTNLIDKEFYFPDS